MVRDEVAAGTQGGSSSCTKGLLWLKRCALGLCQQNAWPAPARLLLAAPVRCPVLSARHPPPLLTLPPQSCAFPGWPLRWPEEHTAPDTPKLCAHGPCADLRCHPSPPPARWLACRRAMQFLVDLLRRLEEDPQALMSACVNEAYASTLQVTAGMHRRADLAPGWWSPWQQMSRSASAAEAWPTSETRCSRMPDWPERSRDARALQDASVGVSHDDKTKNTRDSSR